MAGQEPPIVTMPPGSLTPDGNADIASKPHLDADTISHILFFCSTPTLANACLASQMMHNLAVPLLYRTLPLEFSLHSPLTMPSTRTFSETTPFLPSSPPAPPPPICPRPNPHLDLVHTLDISAHSRAQCSGISSSMVSISPQLFSNLRSVQFRIDKLAHHWPHGCHLISALGLEPEEIAFSAVEEYDDTYWVASLRYLEGIPRSVKRLVIRTRRSTIEGYEETYSLVHDGPNATSSPTDLERGEFSLCSPIDPVPVDEDDDRRDGSGR